MYKICCLLFLVTFVIIFVSCNSQSNNKLNGQVKINLSKDSTAIVIKGIDQFILNEFRTDTLSEEKLQSNFSVFNKVEEDLQDLEKPIKGNYQLIENGISFKPKSPFKKNKIYLVELYIQNPNTDITQQLKRGNSIFKNELIRKEIQF
jgi:hypothetical protein